MRTGPELRADGISLPSPPHLISDPERECEVPGTVAEPAAAPHGEQEVGCRVGGGD